MKRLIFVFVFLFGCSMLEAQEFTINYNHDVPDSNWLAVIDKQLALGDAVFSVWMDRTIAKGEGKADVGSWFITLIEQEVFDAPVTFIPTDQAYNIQMRPEGWSPFEITDSDTIARVPKRIKYRQITVNKKTLDVSFVSNLKKNNPSDAFLVELFPEKVYRSKSKKLEDLKSKLKKDKEKKEKKSKP